MDTLGSYLREEREKQGKTLVDIVRTTRISRTMLEAIESGQDTQLPPPLYLRGLLKIYARALELNPEDVLARMPHHAVPTRVALPRTVNLETPKRPWLKISLAGAAVCIAGLWGWQAFFGFAPFVHDEPVMMVTPRTIQPGTPAAPTVNPEAAASPERAAGAPDTESASAALPVVLPQVNPAPAPASPAVPVAADNAPQSVPESFSVRFAARGVVWMRLRADDAAPVDITLKKGEIYRISAGRSVKARIGNPALLDVWYNDQPVLLPGTPGLPLDATFPDIAQPEQPAR